MKKRLILFAVLILFAIIGGLQIKKLFVPDTAKDVFSRATIRYGASGGDVYELQGRLKFLGYYNGDIDGDFRYQTLRAVKDFQYRFGMRVDGVVGAKTKLKLWEATKNWRPGGQAARRQPAPRTSSPKSVVQSNRRGMSENDIRIMANAVYGESRGEPYVGQVAVAAVILNRVESPNFPKTASGVVFQPGAFTAVADGQIWLTPNERAKKAVRDALSGWDPSGGCIYYFNPVTATSNWIWSRPQVKKIGKHIFCR